MIRQRETEKTETSQVPVESVFVFFLKGTPPTPKPISALDSLIEPGFFSQIETDLTSKVSEVHPIKVFRKKD
jgi:hypothetical protein